MLWKIKNSFGKHNCILLAIIFLLLSTCLFFICLWDPDMMAVFGVIMSIVSFIMFFILLAAAFEEKPEIPIPFFHSLDDEKNHIWTNGTKEVHINEEGNVCSKQTLTHEETSQIAMTILSQRADFHKKLSEFDEYASTEKKVISKLELLQLTRRRHLITEEEYKLEKGTVIQLDLADLWEEFDLRSGDEVTSAQKKIRYLDLLKKRKLIDESEYAAEARYVSVEPDEEDCDGRDSVR